MPEASHFAGSILIVEDDPVQIRLYAQVLSHYRLTCVSTGTAALEAIGEHVPDLILLDHVLARGELGTAFLPRLKTVAAHVPVVIVSGTLDIAGKLGALQGPFSADYVIEKPVDIAELERVVETALTECGLGRTVRSLRSLERAELIEDGSRERLFTERLARQHELLKRLRGSREKPNISDLAGEFHVDRKTIRRDLHDLVHRGQLDPAVCANGGGEA
ncbi:MAG: response regulator [Verrucomicrobiales bacterium]|nr:response regulator [Verrucomicrobiales bacterium]